MMILIRIPLFIIFKDVLKLYWNTMVMCRYKCVDQRLVGKVWERCVYTFQFQQRNHLALPRISYLTPQASVNWSIFCFLLFNILVTITFIFFQRISNACAPTRKDSVTRAAHSTELFHNSYPCYSSLRKYHFSKYSILSLNLQCKDVPRRRFYKS